MSGEESQRNSFWEPCWGCRVARGEFPGIVAYEDAVVVVAINPFSISHGHALVMPRRHIENIYLLTDEVAGPILSAAARIARAAKRAFTADGITLRQNNEPASDQHLFHFHLHVIPRFVGDSEAFDREPGLTGANEQKLAAEKLRAALD